MDGWTDGEVGGELSSVSPQNQSLEPSRSASSRHRRFPPYHRSFPLEPRTGPHRLCTRRADHPSASARRRAFFGETGVFFDVYTRLCAPPIASGVTISPPVGAYNSIDSFAQLTRHIGKTTRRSSHLPGDAA